MTIDIARLSAEIAADEGKRLDVYFCSENVRTVGIGHMLKESDPEFSLNVGDEITDERCTELFTQDVGIATRDCAEIFDTFFELPREAQHVLINMAFQLGRPRLAGFKKFKAAIEAQNWVEAAIEMWDSKWRKQTPERATRLRDRILALSRGEDLTTTQRRVYEAIVDFWKEHQCSPSLRDLAEQLDIFQNAAKETVMRLEEKNYLARRNKRARSIMPINLKTHVRNFYAEG